jgi:thiol-disulfide isomerase/thioredoxin
MSHGKIVGIGVVVVIVVFVGFGIWNRTQPGKYDTFAQCLGEKEAIFYGAFWCPHCQEQKALFGRSKDLLPYTECSSPNGQEQLAVCKDAGIEGYPTWVLKDGERLNSIQSLEILAEKTGCELPV